MYAGNTNQLETLPEDRVLVNDEGDDVDSTSSEEYIRKFSDDDTDDDDDDDVDENDNDKSTRRLNSTNVQAEAAAPAAGGKKRPKKPVKLPPVVGASGAGGAGLAAKAAGPAASKAAKCSQVRRGSIMALPSTMKGGKGATTKGGGHNRRTSDANITALPAAAGAVASKANAAATHAADRKASAAELMEDLRIHGTTTPINPDRIEALLNRASTRSAPAKMREMEQLPADYDDDEATSEETVELIRGAMSRAFRRASVFQTPAGGTAGIFNAAAPPSTTEPNVRAPNVFLAKCFASKWRKIMRVKDGEEGELTNGQVIGGHKETTKEKIIRLRSAPATQRQK